jgi:hypothetical protein
MKDLGMKQMNFSPHQILIKANPNLKTMALTTTYGRMTNKKREATQSLRHLSQQNSKVFMKIFLLMIFFTTNLRSLP